MGRLESLSTAKVSETMQMATAFAALAGGNRGGGLSSEDLRAILREEREASAAALAASEARMTAALAASRASDDDGEPSTAAAAAGALAPMITGKGTLASVGRFIAANPAFAEKALPVVAGVATELLGMFKAIAAPPPPPPVRPVATPRQMAEAAPPPPPPSPPPVDMGPTIETGSLSSWATPAAAVPS
jgi:hypothetical protein